MKRIFATLIVVILGSMLGVGSALASAEKVTMCHATGSETNPYVTIIPAVAAAYNGHLGADHQNGEDIIPPFEWKGVTYSQNWDVDGQAIWENNCNVPEDDPDDPDDPDVLPTTVTPPAGVAFTGSNEVVVLGSLALLSALIGLYFLRRARTV